MIVSFAVVAYNEEKALPFLFESIKNQDYPHNSIEILLIDSMSTDNTYSLMEAFAAEENGFLRTVVLKNEKKNIPAGHNVALDNYTGDALVRVDAHAFVSSDFISRNVELLSQGEMISGGQVETIPSNDTIFARTLLVAENSIFCGGVAKFRRLTKRDYVETMAFGLYRREVFDKVGRYNELLPRSEDNDMNFRVREAGFRLCCDPSIKSVRYNRSSTKALIRQKYLNGYWIGKTLGINPNCFSLFHFVPFSFVIGIIVTSILAAFGIWQLSALMWSVYAVAVVGATIYEIVRNDFEITHLLLPVLFFLLHFCYGVGTLKGLIEMPFWLKKIKKEGND